MYSIVESDALSDEFASNRDGTGGPQYASAFRQTERQDINGIIINDPNACSWQRKFSAEGIDRDGVIFIKDYGRPLPSTPTQ